MGQQQNYYNMPVFKRITLKVKGVSQQFTINVTETGSFYCKLNPIMAAAINQEKIEGNTFSDVEHAVSMAVMNYNKLQTEDTFYIVYRMHLSSYLKEKMPDDLMTEKMWDKTNGVGNQTFGQEDIGVIIEWSPLVSKKLGATVIDYKIHEAKQKDFDYVEQFGHGIAGDYYEPIQGIKFITGSRLWDFQDGGVYFRIPLTEETYKFFSGIENGFMQMI